MTKREGDAQSAAHRLLTSGDDEACRKFFLEKKVNYDLPNEQGCTLLITACAFDRSGLLDELVHSTTNITAATYGNGNNVLHFAALSTHPDVMRVVLEADPARLEPLINVGNANGDTPLMVACTAKYVAGVAALLDHGADVMAANQSYVTALMCASRIETSDEMAVSVLIIELLLSVKELTPECLSAANSSGNTALHIAVQSGNSLGVRSLLQAKCDCRSRNQAGQIPLELARSLGNKEITSLLDEAWTALELEAELKSQELLFPVSKSKKKKSKKKTKARASEEIPQETSSPVDVAVDPNESGCTVCTTATAALHQTFPLFEDMGIQLTNFALADLNSLSMSQLELLQEAYMKAVQVIGDKKVEMARRLEAERVEAQYELEQQILNLP
ncbi:hypothetical protein Ae201684P_014944 [Aphanomyces euteiches]|uniref:Uncharacterized protein n=1 Tax=Aphanomyces euteiches TaxID=100861 RepID=A0A6G0XH79_9STRA|nr:hypothetical protein Ae201684_004832 [Aphanomyces euteiches]KAH9073127.1 hypothetical protein Ae201684P_014944 [Aphanomyces euteiches]KAH9138322.1 hypothetical protein AeRB84_017340 [Aphanomyces euteiches]